MLSGFLDILGETFKIFFRNGKLIPSITLLSIFLNSIFLFSNLFSIKLFVTDFSTKITNMLLSTSGNTTSPVSPDIAGYSYFLHLITIIKDDLRLFIGAELLFFAAIVSASFFFAVATIVASAANYKQKELHVKELLLGVGKSWKRALLTFFYTMLLGLGYAFFVLAQILLPLELIFLNPKSSTISTFSIVALILAMFVFHYLNVVWKIAFTVSVIEQECGLVALGKASKLVKGLKLKGFVLNLLFGGLSYVSSRVMTMSHVNGDLRRTIVPLLVLISTSCLIGAFSWISYTVFYFECKKTHEEEVEMRGFEVEYTKVPAQIPAISAFIP